MSYTISQIIADSKGVVVALDWAYSNVDGTISNQLRLAEPTDVSTMLPRGEVTEAVAITWLEEQLGNTSEDFDKAIAERKAQQEYAETLSAYVNNAGNFVLVEPEVVEPEVVVPAV
jgi:hypothetical protein